MIYYVIIRYILSELSLRACLHISLRYPYMIQRTCCTHCLYPIKTCICSAISPLSNNSMIDIIQHPSEQKAAKNTARLVALCAANTQLWLGESATDFIHLKNQLKTQERSVCIVYPNHTAQPIGTLLTQNTLNNPKGWRFIFLDGTWKKAYKLWQLNPWLHAYPSIHLTAVSSQYHIRKAPHDHCLSTLEAVAHCLHHCEHIDVQPLYNCLHKMQASFMGFAPHKPRCNDSAKLKKIT